MSNVGFRIHTKVNRPAKELIKSVCKISGAEYRRLHGQDVLCSSGH